MRGLGAIVYGPPGVGKTSFALQFPKPLLCLSLHETGYDDFELLKQIPDGCTGYNPSTYESLIKLMDEKPKTLVIDSLSGFEVLFFEYLVRTKYNGDFAKFMSWHVGPRQDAPKHIISFMLTLTNKLNQGTNVLLLGHQENNLIENATGTNYVHSDVTLDKAIREKFYEWSPNIFYMTGQATIEAGKAGMRTDRIMSTSFSLQHAAKNKLGLDPYVPMGNSPQDAFNEFWARVPGVYKQT